MRKPVSAWRKFAAFTLLEVMLVILLMGLLASAVVISFVADSTEDKLNTETERFQQAVQFIASQAMLKQQEWGFFISTKEYRFLYFDGSIWLPANEPQLLLPYSLPDGITAQLELEGLPGSESNLLSQLNWQQDDTLEETEAEAAPVLPQVFILSSGEISPFQVVFSALTAENKPLYSSVSTEFSIPLTRVAAGSDPL